VKRVAALAALVVTGAAGAAPLTVLPKPRFPAPTTDAGTSTVRFRVVASTALDPGRLTAAPKPHGLRFEGPDGGTQHIVVAPGRYAYDFRRYAVPPRIAPGDLNAVDLKTKKLRWRSPALVANADDFVLLDDTIVSGYGFTDEPDYLYAVDRATGRVKGRILLPSAPERIARHGDVLTVDTYDHRLTIRVTGA
jgi:hypothetical protein